MSPEVEHDPSNAPQTAALTAPLEAALGDLPHRLQVGGDERDGTPVVDVEPRDVHAALQRLRDAAGYESLTFVTAIDRWSDRGPVEPRFEVSWQLISFAHNTRARVRARVTTAEPVVPTCVDLWPGAAFMERECHDMFGVRFEGNPDLRRLLMPEAYEHHPLRKDFPHQGIEPDRLYREWDRKRRQEAR